MKAFLLLILISSLSFAAQAQDYTKHKSKTGLDYLLLKPEVIDASTQVLLVLHGCAQSAESMLKMSEIPKYILGKNIVLIAPSQGMSQNPIKCWNFYEEASHTAGNEKSEINKLLSLVSEVHMQLEMKMTEINIIGYSSGGSQAMNLFACYPEKVKGIAVHSGLPHAVATNQREALSVASDGPKATTEELYQKYKNCSGNIQGRKVAVAHGDKDNVVNIKNGRAIAAQILGRDLAENDFDELQNKESQRPFKEAFIQNRYTDLFYIEVQGLRHDWSGSQSKHKKADPNGPAVTEKFLNFLYQ